MKVHKLNESFSVIDAPRNELEKMFEYLKVERPGAYFDVMVKNGMKSPYDYFASFQNNMLLVMNGHLQLLEQFGVHQHKDKSEYSNVELEDFICDIIPDLPFKPYDFQIKAFKESILNSKQINRMATGCGKSLTISLICEFFRRNGKKGLLLVPNINLLTQFKNDIKDYNLKDLHNNIHIIGGGSTERHFNKSLTISTWQSMLACTDKLNEIDYVITDEAHRFASEETSTKKEVIMENDNDMRFCTVTDSSGDNFVIDMKMITYAYSKGFWFNKKVLIGLKCGERLALKVRSTANAEYIVHCIGKGLYNMLNIQKGEDKDG
jgi:hypothetical protein